jgi:hypothetical protein
MGKKPVAPLTAESLAQAKRIATRLLAMPPAPHKPKLSAKNRQKKPHTENADKRRKGNQDPNA